MVTESRIFFFSFVRLDLILVLVLMMLALCGGIWKRANFCRFTAA